MPSQLDLRDTDHAVDQLIGVLSLNLLLPLWYYLKLSDLFHGYSRLLHGYLPN